MLRTLVVPLDGSALAEAAVPYAVRLVQASGGRLVLVRAADRGNVEESRSYLKRIAATRVTGAVDIATPEGDALAAIFRVVEEYDADEIVLATRGRTGPTHLLFGSVAEAVLAHSPVPVFLVHAQVDASPSPAFDPVSARVIVPLDGSVFSEAALPVALDFLGSAGDLVLVRSVQPPGDTLWDERGNVIAYLDQIEESARSNAFDYLTLVAARIRQRAPDMRVTCEARVGDAVNAIVTVQLDTDAHLVVMATRGRTGISRSMIGSVAGGVLRSGTCPVLLVSPTWVDAGSALESHEPTRLSA